VVIALLAAMLLSRDMPHRGTGDYLSAEKDLGEYFKKPSIEGV